MKPNHIQIRIEQCLSLAKASHCPRRKLAAMLIDPKRNVILADGYNGGPRGASGKLCKGHYCERNGVKAEDLEIRESYRHLPRSFGAGSRGVQGVGVYSLVGEGVDPKRNGILAWFERTILDDMANKQAATGKQIQMLETGKPLDLKGETARAKAEAYAADLVEKHPPIESGTRMERGCHHAEMNVVCNAAAGGVQTAGAWLIVLAEPCMMCAKLIHHAGITKVIVVDGGYLGGKAGVEYLRENGVKVQEVEGPKDPRIARKAP
jgi:deoxycytidylate deaminase